MVFWSKQFGPWWSIKHIGQVCSAPSGLGGSIYVANSWFWRDPNRSVEIYLSHMEVAIVPMFEIVWPFSNKQIMLNCQLVDHTTSPVWWHQTHQGAVPPNEVESCAIGHKIPPRCRNSLPFVGWYGSCLGELGIVTKSSYWMFIAWEPLKTMCRSEKTLWVDLLVSMLGLDVWLLELSIKSSGCLRKQAVVV